MAYRGEENGRACSFSRQGGAHGVVPQGHRRDSVPVQRLVIAIDFFSYPPLGYERLFAHSWNVDYPWPRPERRLITGTGIPYNIACGIIWRCWRNDKGSVISCRFHMTEMGAALALRNIFTMSIIHQACIACWPSLKGAGRKRCNKYLPVNLDKAPTPPEEEIVFVHDRVPLSNTFQALGEYAGAPVSGMDVDNASIKLRTSASSDCSGRLCEDKNAILPF